VGTTIGKTSNQILDQENNARTKRDGRPSFEKLHAEYASVYGEDVRTIKRWIHKN
jgi:hypothetical protein